MTFDSIYQVAVIGDGAWGTALALLLHEKGYRVTVWGPFPEYIETLRMKRENIRFLPGVNLPPEIDLTSSLPAALDQAQVCVLAVPTRYFRAVVTRMSGLVPSDCRVISVAKGLDPETFDRMSQVAETVLGLRHVAVLSGPSHAEEVARSIPTAVVVASPDPEINRFHQSLFATPRFRVYTSPDVVGVELGGALKNVIAIAVGVSDGLGFGDNTRAALMTRGLAEMTRLGCAMGAQATTFAGLSGMGDLIATCTSRHSRNRNAGERLGRGEPVKEILASTQQAVEGIWNCAAVWSLAQRYGVEMPVTGEVYAVVHEGKRPLDAMKSLMARDLKPE